MIRIKILINLKKAKQRRFLFLKNILDKTIGLMNTLIQTKEYQLFIYNFYYSQYVYKHKNR